MDDGRLDIAALLRVGLPTRHVKRDKEGRIASVYQSTNACAESSNHSLLLIAGGPSLQGALISIPAFGLTLGLEFSRLGLDELVEGRLLVLLAGRRFLGDLRKDVP